MSDDHTCQYVHAFHTDDPPCAARATYVVHTEFFRDATAEEKAKYGDNYFVSEESTPGVFACAHHLGSTVGLIATSLAPSKHAHFNAIPLDC